MSWFSKIFSGSVGTFVEKVGGVIDRFTLTKEEKEQFKIDMASLVQERDSDIEETIRTRLKVKETILVAELTQGDKYTKRARPTVVYAGLGFIFYIYCLVPVVAKIFGSDMPPLTLPDAFWAGWSGIVATWSIGRTMEKRGASNRFSRAVTGSRLLDDDSAEG